MISIYPIVEGHGEVRASPLLIRRIFLENLERYDVVVLPPHRVKRGRMLADNSADLLRAVALGAMKINQSGHPGGILVLLDADDDCAAELGPMLLDRVHRDDMQVSVVVATCEYEAWFLAGARSLSQRRTVRDDAIPPDNPEGIRDAKGYLERHILVEEAVYRETVDQPSLTEALSLEEARACPSFDKLCRELDRFIVR